MSRNNNESIVVVPIPENFATGGTFLGFEIKPLNIIQAIVLGIIPIGINFGVIYRYFYVDILTMLGVTALFSVAFAFLGFVGIDNVTPLEYLMKIIKFKSKERKTYFNPRVKKEIVSLISEQSENTQVLPREKVIKMYNEFLEKRNLSDQARAHELENSDIGEDALFEEDFAVMDKPDEYMSDKELKEKAKKEKQILKTRKKEQKKREKQKLKQEKQEKKKQRKDRKIGAEEND